MSCNRRNLIDHLFSSHEYPDILPLFSSLPSDHSNGDPGTTYNTASEYQCSPELIEAQYINQDLVPTLVIPAVSALNNIEHLSNLYVDDEYYRSSDHASADIAHLHHFISKRQHIDGDELPLLHTQFDHPNPAASQIVKSAENERHTECEGQLQHVDDTSFQLAVAACENDNLAVEPHVIQAAAAGLIGRSLVATKSVDTRTTLDANDVDDHQHHAINLDANDDPILGSLHPRFVGGGNHELAEGTATPAGDHSYLRIEAASHTNYITSTTISMEAGASCHVMNLRHGICSSDLEEVLDILLEQVESSRSPSDMNHYQDVAAAAANHDSCVSSSGKKRAACDESSFEGAAQSIWRQPMPASTEDHPRASWYCTEQQGNEDAARTICEHTKKITAGSCQPDDLAFPADQPLEQQQSTYMALSANIKTNLKSSIKTTSTKAAWIGPTLTDVQKALESKSNYKLGCSGLSASVMSTDSSTSNSINSSNSTSLILNPNLDHGHNGGQQLADNIIQAEVGSADNNQGDKTSFLTDEVALLCKDDLEQAHELVDSWRARLQKRGGRAGPSYRVRVSSEEEAARDGYRWRKYGQKTIKNSPFPRCYYKCTSGKCQVKKQVERCTNQSKTFLVTYEGLHDHNRPDVCHMCASSSNFGHSHCPSTT